MAAGRGSRFPPPRHAARRGANSRMGGHLRFGRGTGTRHRAQCVDQSGGLGDRMPQHGRAGRAAILEIGASGGVAMLTQAVLDGEGIEVLDVSGAEGKAALFGG